MARFTAQSAGWTLSLKQMSQGSAFLQLFLSFKEISSGNLNSSGFTYESEIETIFLSVQFCKNTSRNLQ
jgi:hypothetical protein